MFQSVLATKLHIPRSRGRLVERERLFRQLSEGLDSSLTLVTAPTGFGKSTLISEWVRTQSIPTAWLSLDATNSNSSQFVLHLIASLQSIQSDIAQPIVSAISGGDTPSIETLFSILINELVVSEELIIVLDDYHVVDSVEIDRGVAFFVANLPEHIHPIIASRTRPDLSLARIRARNSLTEIDASDLRFSSEEIQLFFDYSDDLPLSKPQVQSILQRTEGWVAGIQLAELALKRSADIDTFVETFTGSHRYVMDYLTDEVLDHLSTNEKEFLIRTSILHEFCGELCDALTQQGNGQELLEHLENMNLFLIPLDNQRRWYRYHHLFATLLQHRFAQVPREKQTDVHLRAAQWYEANEFIEATIEHYQKANTLKDVARLIRYYGIDYLHPGRLNRLQDWLSALSDGFIQNDAELATIKAWIHYFLQQRNEVETWVSHAIHILENNSQSRPWLITILRSWIAYQHHDFERAIQFANEAIDDLADSESTWLGTGYLFLGYSLDASGRSSEAQEAFEASLAYPSSENHIAVTTIIYSISFTKILRGKLKEGFRLIDQLTNRVIEAGQLFSASLPRLTRLYIMYEQNNFSIMEAELEDLWQLLQFDESLTTARFRYVQLTYYNAIGDVERVLGLLEKLVQDVQTWTNIDEKTRFLAGLIRTYLKLGETDYPQRWLQDLEIETEDITMVRMDEHLAVADTLRFSDSAQDHQRALAIIGSIHQLCEQAGLEGYRIDVHCLEALLMVAAGDTLGALAPLRRALAVGEPEGYVRTFVDYGKPMAQLLYEAVARNIHGEYAGFLLSQFPDDRPAQRQTRHPDLIEALSERETQILQLLATGLSNQEIAKQIFLAVNTVKVHNRKIYAKLHAKNRNEAVAKARQFGIID